MPVLPRLAALWRNLLHRRRVERELDDELRSTLDMLVDAKLRQGMPPEDARRAAAIELGGLAVVTGLSVAVTTKTTCSSAEFEQFGVACDRV